MISFLYGNTREMKPSSSIFHRLGLTGSSESEGQRSHPKPSSIQQKQRRPQSQDVSDHNCNVNPDIEAAEVLIDNDDVLSSGSSLETVHRVQTPLQADCPLFCILCNNGFSSQAGLREHLRSHPICVLCGNQFLRNSDLLEHWQKHPQCGICGDRVLNQAALEEHEVGHDNFEDSLTALITNNTNLGKTLTLEVGCVHFDDSLYCR